MITTAKKMNCVNLKVAKLMRQLGFYSRCTTSWKYLPHGGVATGNKPAIVLVDHSPYSQANPQKDPVCSNRAATIAVAPLLHVAKDWVEKRFGIKIYATPDFNVGRSHDNWIGRYYISGRARSHAILNKRENDYLQFKSEWVALNATLEVVLSNIIKNHGSTDNL